jgi:hypothetical protein
LFCKIDKLYYIRRGIIKLSDYFCRISTEGIVRDIFVTTDPAPITHPFPIVIPGQITELPPIQQSSPIVMGKALSSVFLVSASSGWVAVYNCTRSKKNTLEPIVTFAGHLNVTQFTLKKTLFRNGCFNCQLNFQLNSTSGYHFFFGNHISVLANNFVKHGLHLFLILPQ